MTGETNAPQGGAGSTRQPCPNEEDDTPEEPRIKIRAALFFDGTLNNRTNVTFGPGGAPVGGNLLGSYDNYYSNVSNLEDLWREDQAADHSFSLYVEGIGTENQGYDNPIGAAFGTYPGSFGTGVKAKVNRGIRRLVRRIDSVASNPQIEYVHVDAYGFSRGAAAARYFVHCILHRSRNTLADQLSARGYTVGTVQVKFVGLFDTVASFGRNHGDDTGELKLDAIRDAEKVVQLSAAEEHRKNFRLTNIASAGNGTQIFLPGVHSDVGGGYNDGASESDVTVLELSGHTDSDDLNRLSVERQWLIDKGWNHPDEIHVSAGGNKVRVTRQRIGSHYERIPLRLMAKLSAKFGVRFSGRLALSFPIPPALSAIKERIDEYVAGLGTSRRSDWINDNSAMMKSLRHDFLHHSAHYDGAGTPHEPQWSHNDPRNGRRRRTIQHG